MLTDFPIDNRQFSIRSLFPAQSTSRFFFFYPWRQLLLNFAFVECLMRGLLYRGRSLREHCPLDCSSYTSFALRRYFTLEFFLRSRRKAQYVATYPKSGNARTRWEESRSRRHNRSALRCYSTQRVRSSPPISDSAPPALAEQGKPAGINDLAALNLEASSLSNQGQADPPDYWPSSQSDFESWATLLKHQIHVDGDEGIKEVWRYLTSHSRVGDVIDHWPLVDALWPAFIGLGHRDQAFLEQIGTHAKELWRYRKLRRPNLYVEVIGGLLSGIDPSSALRHSGTMHPGVPITDSELRALFKAAASSPKQTQALQSFRQICDTVQGHRIYDSVVTKLCDDDRVSEALQMHSYLLDRHDCPSSFQAIEPIIRKMIQHGLDLDGYLGQLEAAGVFFTGQVRSLHNSIRNSTSSISREARNIAVCRAFGMRPTVVRDDFAARLFATKAFSFNFALNTLHLLNVQELGPLSLREIALRSCIGPVFRQRIRQLYEKRIDTGASVYARVIRRFAENQQDFLLTSVIECDHHPDVFESCEAQSKLLQQYQRARDWVQVSRTLFVLQTLGTPDRRARNLLLHNTINQRDLPATIKFLAQINQQSEGFDIRNLLDIDRLFLPAAGAQKSVVFSGPYFLRSLVQLRNQFLMAGVQSPGLSWRELLHQLGKNLRTCSIVVAWADFERTCLWLCSLYSSPAASRLPPFSSDGPTVLPTTVKQWRRAQLSTLQDVFPPLMQRAIVRWGFLTFGSTRWGPKKSTALLDGLKNPRRRTLVPGLELLVRMKTCYGLRLDVQAIEQSCRKGLRQLSYAGGDSSLKRNRPDRARNEVRLREYIGCINQVWGGNLVNLDDPQTFQELVMGVKPRRKGFSPFPQSNTDNSG